MFASKAIEKGAELFMSYCQTYKEESSDDIRMIELMDYNKDCECHVCYPSDDDDNCDDEESKIESNCNNKAEIATAPAATAAAATTNTTPTTYKENEIEKDHVDGGANVGVGVDECIKERVNMVCNFIIFSLNYN